MATDRLRVLIGKGYFPSVLPTTFTTADFGLHSRDVLRDWSNSRVVPTDYREPAQLRTIKSTEPEDFSAPKGNRERRIMSIVNPVSQVLLTDLISRNWQTISRWMVRSKFTRDVIDVVEDAPRAIPSPEFILHRAHKDSISSVANWITETDVTRFYPSIYTHSIAWAAYGKEIYKRNPKKYNGSLADQLDIATRKCNRDQTIGIPIGPDTSRIISEIISASVDNRVYRLTSLPTAEANRLQDDWWIGSSSLEEAEARLSGVIRAYQELGLDINGRKTSMKHIAELVISGWRAELLSMRTAGMRGERLTEFLSRAISLQIEERSESILPYVFAILDGFDVKGSDIPTLQSFIMRAVAVDPRVMDDACILLLNLHHEGFKLNAEKIFHRFVPLLESAIKTGHSFETIWCLHLFRGMRINLSRTKVATLAELAEPGSIPLVMLDLESNGLLSKLPKRAWNKLIENSDFRGPIWLLAYEGVRHGWLLDPSGNIARNPMFEPMLRRNIQFYDPKRNVPRRFTLNQRRLALRRIKVAAALADWSPYP